MLLSVMVVLRVVVATEKAKLNESSSRAIAARIALKRLAKDSSLAISQLINRLGLDNRVDRLSHAYTVHTNNARNSE